jgi:hypothetical protein
MPELAKHHEIKAAHAVSWHCSPTATTANPHERRGPCSPCLLGSAAICGSSCTGSIGRSAVVVAVVAPAWAGRPQCQRKLCTAFPGGLRVGRRCSFLTRWAVDRGGCATGGCRTRRGGRSGRPAAPGEVGRRARPRSPSRSGPCSGWPRSIGCGVGADRVTAWVQAAWVVRPGPGTPGRRGRGCRRPRLTSMTCGSGASAGAAQEPSGLAELAPVQVSRAPRRAARCVRSRVVSVGRPAADRSARRSARLPNLRARLRGSASWPP